MFFGQRSPKQHLSHQHLRRSLTAHLNNLFWGRCALCERPGARCFCIDCQRQLAEDCAHYLPAPPLTELPVWALGPYKGALKQSLAKLKYGHQPHLGTALGQVLGRQWIDQPSGHSASHSRLSPICVAIPLHAERETARGYNQAELIATRFSQVCGLRHQPNGLRRIKATVPQHALGRVDRQTNLAAAFAVSDRLQQRRRRSHHPIHILLVDDIYTTGVTAQTAANTLTAAGFTVVGIVTVARAVSQI